MTPVTIATERQRGRKVIFGGSEIASLASECAEMTLYRSFPGLLLGVAVNLEAFLKVLICPVEDAALKSNQGEFATSLCGPINEAGAYSRNPPNARET